VSVIIPVYNGQRYLGEAIRSVLGQTYPHVECLVVDDGSTDGSAAVADSFGDRVNVVRKANGGVASARNAGIAVARGELFAFLDADDIWHPDKLERQVQCWSSRPSAGMVYTGYTVVKDLDQRPLFDIHATEPHQRLRRAVLVEGYGIGFSCTAMVSRAAAEELGSFDERLSIGADLEYAWRLSQRFEVLAVPEVLAVYRLHTEAQMHNDLLALEHDTRRIIATAFPEQTPEWRRAMANLHTHLVFAWIRRRDPRQAARHVRAVTEWEARRLLVLPLTAAGRRLIRRLLSRWPARVPQPQDLCPAAARTAPEHPTGAAGTP
jgi:glycosyltransferase involved in cell wall biosynthesis